MDVRFTLFGAPAVRHADTLHALDFERRTQLVAFLALKRAWIGRAELAALLWPEQPTKLAFANLRKALFRLQSLPWAAALDVNGHALRLDVRTDVEAFEGALRERRLADALALRSGELLAGFDDPANATWTDWLAFERDRLRAAWRAAAGELLAGEADPPHAVAIATRLVDDDPLDESAVALLVTWLARSGQGAQARAAYRACAERLQRELGLEPSAQLKALVESIGTNAPAAPGRAAEAAIPRDSGFVGRLVELRRIAALLADDACRLLTITGPGGVGKTRLAQRVLTEIGPTFADGAIFVPLDDLVAGSEFGARVARELDVAPKDDSDPLDAAIDALRERHMLLVFDNFEQLADDTTPLDRLLAACPRVKAIVTSRVRLGRASEWLLPLEGLPCPEDEDRDRLEAFDAARLFIRAARRMSPALVPSIEAPAIVDICQLVEGLPLALELAAAWTRVLSCEAIAAELRRGTELLQATDASRPTRHASVDIVFDHSWRLLTLRERDALARLSVLHGSFTVEAARAVAAAPLPVFAALADKSLLHRDGTRLRLHPLVQQLAAQRLGDGDAQQAARAAHAGYFHHLLVQLRPASEDGEREALATIDLEFENCRRAWEFSVATQESGALARSVPTLLNHWEHRARFAEGLELLRGAIDAPVAAADARLRALLLGEASLLEYRLGRYAEAEASATRALDTRAARGGETRFRALSVLAACAISTSRLDEAKRLYTLALKNARAEARAHDIAATLENLALAEKRLGRYDESLQLTVEALAQHRRNGDVASIALCLSNLGSMYLFMQRNDAAAAHLEEALALSERGGLVSTLAYVLANLTELAMKAGEDDLARRHAQRALEVAEAHGMRPLAGWLRAQLARLATRRGDAGAAHRELAAASALALTLGAPYLKAAILLALAELLEASGQRAAPRRVLAFGVEQAAFSAPDREELRAEWRRRPAAAGAEAPWPPLALDELLNRLVVEETVRHQPLMALLEPAS